MMSEMTEAEYAEALSLARASLGHGGQRTFLAKAPLRAEAEAQRLREQIEDMRGNPDDRDAA